MKKNKNSQIIFTLMILVSIACNSKRNIKTPEQIFNEILNIEQVLTSDTIRIMDEFSTTPQEIFRTISFTISDSIITANNKQYFPFKFNNNDKEYYLSFWNDTLFLSDLKEEQALLIFNAKNLWKVEGNGFIPESQLSKVESLWNNEIKDTVFVFAVKENQPHISDTPFLTQIYFSKKQGFLKFIYTVEFMNNKILECYNRKNGTIK